MLSAKQFQTRLLTWFDQFGRKQLPWQKQKTPYHVWISEIMLQQTQVSTVIPYFNRFIDYFPNIRALANAQQDEILHLWSGLGYYTRARNLQKAAKLIIEQYGGQLPNTQELLQTLPGVGQSTAGAILALAFKKQAVILDGNVKRVLSRLHGILEPINEKNTEQRLWQLATLYTPKSRVDDYTQAMMDLGATLCTRSNPRCEICPLQNNCLAFKNKLVTQLPKKKMKVKRPTKTATFLIIKMANKILLHKRPEKGIWGGLWSLPELEGKPNLETIHQFCQKKYRLIINQLQFLTTFRHSFTHYHLDIFPVLLIVEKIRIRLEDSEVWYNFLQPKTIGLPKPIQTILRTVT